MSESALIVDVLKKLLKSRGMAHSNQVREFHMSSDGIRLRAAYLGPEGVLTGSAVLIVVSSPRRPRLTSPRRPRARVSRGLRE